MSSARYGTFRRGWDNLTAEEKRRWKENRIMQARELTKHVAHCIVDLIKEGVKCKDRSLGWRNPWVPPQNIIYGNRYVGLNSVSLTAQARERGQRDCRFLTTRALFRLQDKNGESAALIDGAQPYHVMTPRREQDMPLRRGEDVSKYDPSRVYEKEDGSLWLKGRLFFSSVRVYSVADTTADVPPLSIIPPECFIKNEFIEKMVRSCGARIVHDPTRGAYYSHVNDVIFMPPKEHFESPEMYYSTLCHEFFHWTGHKDRENRETSDTQDYTYAQEELRAELFAAVSSVMFGLHGTLDRSADYIESWNKCMRRNPKDILAMASQVQRVVGAIYDLADGLQPKLEWLKGRDFSDVPTPLLDARKNGEDLDAAWRKEVGLEAWAEREGFAQGNSQYA